MNRLPWLGAWLVLLAVLLPARAWALRCGTHIVEQGEYAAQVREQCGAPFYMDYYVGPPGIGVNTPVEPGAAVTTEVWYYNFGPQRLMVRLEFSGGVLVREQTLGYGFVGRGGPCDYTKVTTGMSVADLIARCGFPEQRNRNPLPTGAYLGPRAPAWGETWFYAAGGGRAGLAVQLQRGVVTGVRLVH